jgi:hypothetical protein
MICANCGNEAPEDSRYCNMCGLSLHGSPVRHEATPRIEHRWIYIDLFDLRLPADLSSLDDRSEVVTYLYERFTAFADEGWEWVVHPADPSFTGWVEQVHWGDRLLAGADLLCTRIVSEPLPGSEDAGNYVPSFRMRQLAQNRWRYQPGTSNKA